MMEGNRVFALALILGVMVVWIVNMVFSRGLVDHEVLFTTAMFGFGSGVGSDATVVVADSTLPDGVDALEACSSLKSRFFDRADRTPEHVLKSSRHHWKQLNCAELLARRGSQVVSNILSPSKSQPPPQPQSNTQRLTQTQTSSASRERMGVTLEPINAKERSIREAQEAQVAKCHALREETGIKPGRSWGRATKQEQKEWTGSQCDRYGAMTPGTVHNEATPLIDTRSAIVSPPAAVTASALLAGSGATRAASITPPDSVPFGGGGDQAISTNIKSGTNGSELHAIPGGGSEALAVLGDRKADTEWCFQNKEKYNVVPMKSWGTLPKSMQLDWKEHTCDVIFSLKRRKAYKMVECPVSNFNDTSLPLIAIMAASTTRKVRRPSPKTMSLFTYLLPSLRTSIDCGFRYVFVMGYDEGDPYHDTQGGMAKTRAWFDQHISGVLRTKGIHVDFLPVAVRNTVRKPGPVFIAMARAAYSYGADFFYRVNDDTEMVGRWPTRFVKSLTKLPPPYGVIGPFCDANKKILTHDFVHRTHMEIFEMNYYPPALVDWWMDDWVTLVYGWGRTFQSRGAEVIHHTGAHGQRYEVDRANEAKVDLLVKQGRQLIRAWMLKHNAPEREIQAFDKETKPHYRTGNIKIQMISEKDSVSMATSLAQPPRSPKVSRRL